MKVPSRMKIVEDERKCEKTSKTRKEVTELFKFLKTMNKQATKRTGQFLKQLEKKEGKETKRETLLKQIKDVDELMNEELRNARKFVERQQLFEKKYMVGSKLGEQAPRKNALILIEQSDVQSSWVDEAMGKMTLKDLDVKGKRAAASVFIRVDFNVPQDKNDPSVITNTQRIDGHMAREERVLNLAYISTGVSEASTISSRARKYSLAPVAKAAEEQGAYFGVILGQSILFLKDCVGSEVEAACADPEPGSVILLENLRFHIEEEGKNEAKEKADPEKVKEFRASLVSDRAEFLQGKHAADIANVELGRMCLKRCDAAAEVDMMIIGGIHDEQLLA
ncbi:PGK2 [Symbiodinium sp. CCMP2456]|nr:PGK2 [Symbiodinium sp. CCMP2456]